MDVLIANHCPQICLLTEIGLAVKGTMPIYPNYIWLTQEGTNSFGGVAILYHQSVKCNVVENDLNFLLIELDIIHASILLGVVYIPPSSLPPFHLFAKCLNKPFYIFGDFNAKHVSWNCVTNNTNGNHLVSWLEQTGNEMIFPYKATSRRSKAIIDFGITHDACGWNSEVLEEGSSDHHPILFQSPYSLSSNSFFRKTNWNIFIYFLSCIYEYWLSLVYNLDEQTFFSLFSQFIAALSDRCSIYENIKIYRPPWPPYLVRMARNMNRRRRIYRREKSQVHLNNFVIAKELFFAERESYLQEKRKQKLEWMKEGHNIWKSARPYFHTYFTPLSWSIVTTWKGERSTKSG